LIQAEIATWLLRDAEAPFGESTTISRVEMTGDLRHANVFVLIHGEAVTSEAAVAYLRNEAGRLRGRIGRALHLRRVPELHFRYDRPYEEAARVEGILASLHDQQDGTPPSDGNAV
jgi:ribosome-binding factor A